MESFENFDKTWFCYTDKHVKQYFRTNKKKHIFEDTATASSSWPTALPRRHPWMMLLF